jgi:hypothetical protein
MSKTIQERKVEMEQLIELAKLCGTNGSVTMKPEKVIAFCQRVMETDENIQMMGDSLAHWVKEAKEAQLKLSILQGIMDKAMKEFPVGNVSSRAPESLPEKVKDLKEELVKVREELYLQGKELNDLKAALGYHRAWPLFSVLTKLTAAADILLHEYDYDDDGWEGLQFAMESGKTILADIQAMSNKPQKPEEPEEKHCGLCWRTHQEEGSLCSTCEADNRIQEMMDRDRE